MRARHIGVVVALVVALAGCGDERDPSIPAPKTDSQRVVDNVAAQWPLPNPRDTSSDCKDSEGDVGARCGSQVTTDAVTVTQYADAQTAQRAAERLRTLVGVTSVQAAGRFVLSWREGQEMTEEARALLVSVASSG
ncbi:hypothetical protein ACGFIR_06375 [Micromonospora sp. NPDC049051]|uniref:hypothetical protein n=1 Tax=unclassified Micromonospora TaxID=2617518 RepID=UPI003711C7FA